MNWPAVSRWACSRLIGSIALAFDGPAHGGRQGRVQPRHPADPLRELLRLPRARQNHRKADLRLDLRDAALAKEAIVPGKPDESELVARILSDDADEVMPPPKSHKTLTAEQKELLEALGRRGGGVPAALGLRRPDAARRRRRSKRRRWVRNPIDAFILATLEAEGIDAVARGRPADAAPPAQPRPDRPAADARRRSTRSSTTRDPDAYEQLVDRLLASPHYGERMAVPWLDARPVRRHRRLSTATRTSDICPYRDYVIDAFNANMPFDQFTIEQLAGDLLPDPTPEQLVATGFNR